MNPKKKHVRGICGVLIFMFVCILYVGTGSAVVEDSPYITINPVGDNAIGDIITISGTTNFPVNTTLWIQAGPKEFTKYPPHYIGEVVQVVQGTNSNLWSVRIDTSSFAIDEYSVLVSPLNEETVLVCQAWFNMTARRASSVPTMGASPTSLTEWIAVDNLPVSTHYTGDSFTISGKTNLPVGHEIVYVAFISKFLPGSQDLLPPSFSGSTLVNEGADEKNTWSFVIDTTQFSKRFRNGSVIQSDAVAGDYTLSIEPSGTVLYPFTLIEKDQTPDEVPTGIESGYPKIPLTQPPTTSSPLPYIIPVAALGIMIAYAGVLRR